MQEALNSPLTPASAKVAHLTRQKLGKFKVAFRQYLTRPFDFE